MKHCGVCHDERWIEVENYPGCVTLYQCPVCCFFPPLTRPWPWEHAQVDIYNGGYRGDNALSA